MAVVEAYCFEALKAGASGCVLKTVADRDLVDACRAAMRGEPFLYPPTIRTLMSCIESMHAQCGAPAGDLARGLQSAAARHRHVKNGKVDVAPSKRTRPPDAVGGLRGDPKVRGGIENRAQAAAHDLVIVGDEHARTQRNIHRASPAGTVNLTSVPPASSARMLKQPPISIARLRMPARPVPVPFVSWVAMPRPSSRTHSSTWPRRS
jgi:hypothetical protein